MHTYFLLGHANDVIACGLPDGGSWQIFTHRISPTLLQRESPLLRYYGANATSGPKGPRLAAGGVP
jgi:hypothetical protein